MFFDLKTTGVGKQSKRFELDLIFSITLIKLSYLDSAFF